MFLAMGNHLEPFSKVSHPPEGQEQGSEPSRVLILDSKPMVWTMGNHLGPFSKVSDPPEGQEQDGGAVGDQG